MSGAVVTPLEFAGEAMDSAMTGLAQGRRVVLGMDASMHELDVTQHILCAFALEVGGRIARLEAAGAEAIMQGAYSIARARIGYEPDSDFLEAVLHWGKVVRGEGA